VKPSPAILWWIFWALAGLQFADLITTYRILALGGREGNIFMRGIITTPLAPLLKTFVLTFTALLVIRSTRFGRPASHRLLLMMGVVALVYVAVIVNNASIILRR